MLLPPSWQASWLALADDWLASGWPARPRLRDKCHRRRLSILRRLPLVDYGAHLHVPVRLAATLNDVLLLLLCEFLLARLECVHRSRECGPQMGVRLPVGCTS